MEFKVNIRSKGDQIDIVTGTGDAWSAYIYANEAGNISGLGAGTDTSYFDISVYNEDQLGGSENLTIFSASNDILVQPGGIDTAKFKEDGSIQLLNYGAGVLTSDGSGNITSVLGGGGGISESLAIAYAVALG